MKERIEDWLKEVGITYESTPERIRIIEYATSRCAAKELGISILEDRIEILFDWVLSRGKPNPLELPEQQQQRYKAALSFWLSATTLQYETVGKSEHGLPEMIQLFYPIYEDGLTKDNLLRGLDLVCRGQQLIQGSLLTQLC